jgi:hypothetical protein
MSSSSVDAVGALRRRHADHLKLTPLIWIVSPTGSAPLNRFVTTVGPSTTTRIVLLDLRGGEEVAGLDRVVVRGRVGRRRADELRGRVGGRAVDERRAGGHRRRRGLHVRRAHLVLQRIGVGDRQRDRRRDRHRRAAEAEAGLDQQHVRAERLDARLRPPSTSRCRPRSARSPTRRRSSCRGSSVRSAACSQRSRSARGAASRKPISPPPSPRGRQCAPGIGARSSSPTTSPSARWITRRACSATSGSWVMITIVRPSSCRRSKIASTSPVECESRLPVGSSARIIVGLVTSARAIATRCCWPPESSAGAWWARFASRPATSAAAARRRRSSRGTRA